MKFNIQQLTLLIFTPLFLTSCFENETVLINEENEENLYIDDDLTSLMKSVTSHKAYYDDFIDDSHCFSINFPYEIIINNEAHEINTYDDLDEYSDVDYEIELVYPLSISLTNFEIHNINNETELNSLKLQCNEGILYDEHIECAEFVYPIKLTTYNTQSRRFDLIEINNDKDTFSFLNELDNYSIFRLVYPANIYMFQQEYFSIENNFSLETHFKIAHNTCGIRDE
ncbi:hypothetical protein [Psychroflexus salis]|uniref:Lipoprotein n=1 Tax=Psychroflexus salis TaxID=1526574 RepID=A0A916ZPC3_9FLAO|nr:hypothetical protein [Psychroflexus salis]GGE07530.1 hypothetical protein GCM10010831_06340 [Psychroflexus salis]